MSFNQLNQEEKVPKGWSYVKVKNIAEINEKSISKDFKYQEIEYIEISKVNNGMISEIKRIDVKKAPSRAKRIVRNNDILISSVRPNLKHYTFINKASKNLIASTGFVIITPLKIHPRYLYYCLTSEKYTNYLTQIAESHTSAYPSFNPDIIENSVILKPPVAEEYFIGEFLGFLDDKIHINHWLNETLEKIAQTIFKSWFIDFQPFQDGEFEDTKLGAIPKGWKIAKLGDYIEFIKGKKPKVIISKPIDENYLPQILISSFEGGSNGYANVEGLTVSDIFDPIMVMDGASSGRIEIGYKGIIGSTLSKIFLKHLNKFFVYYFLKQKEVMINSNVTGTAIPHADKSLIKNFDIILAPKNIIEMFSDNVKNIISRIISNRKETRILTKVRNLFLPQLISGRIRIENPELLLGEINN